MAKKKPTSWVLKTLKPPEFVRERIEGEKPRARSGADIAKLFRSLSERAQEEVMAVGLSTSNQIVLAWQVSRGSVNASTVHPREVFAPAVAERFAAVVLLHNHPSGDPTPSREDAAITKRLKAAGEILGIELLDHIVLGASSYYSIADMRAFPYPE